MRVAGDVWGWEVGVCDSTGEYVSKKKIDTKIFVLLIPYYLLNHIRLDSNTEPGGKASPTCRATSCSSHQPVADSTATAAGRKGLLYSVPSARGGNDSYSFEARPSTSNEREQGAKATWQERALHRIQAKRSVGPEDQGKVNLAHDAGHPLSRIHTQPSDEEAARASH